jgi:hypothetical protein
MYRFDDSRSRLARSRAMGWTRQTGSYCRILRSALNILISWAAAAWARWDNTGMYSSSGGHAVHCVLISDPHGLDTTHEVVKLRVGDSRFFSLGL